MTQDRLAHRLRAIRSRHTQQAMIAQLPTRQTLRTPTTAAPPFEQSSSQPPKPKPRGAKNANLFCFLAVGVFIAAVIAVSASSVIEFTSSNNSKHGDLLLSHKSIETSEQPERLAPLPDAPRLLKLPEFTAPVPLILKPPAAGEPAEPRRLNSSAADVYERLNSGETTSKNDRQAAQTPHVEKPSPKKISPVKTLPVKTSPVKPSLVKTQPAPAAPAKRAPETNELVKPKGSVQLTKPREPRRLRAESIAKPFVPIRPVDRAKRLVFRFQAAPWDYVLSRFAIQFGLRLQLDDVPRGTFTHQERKLHTPNEAFQILNTHLKPRGYRLEQHGRLLILVNEKRAEQDSQ